MIRAALLPTTLACLAIGSPAAASDMRLEVDEATIGNFASVIEVGGDHVKRLKVRVPCLSLPFSVRGGERSGTGASVDNDNDDGNGMYTLLETRDGGTIDVTSPQVLGIEERVAMLRETLNELERQECRREMRVPWSWEVISVDADVTRSGAVLTGILEVRAGDYRGAQAFEMPLNVTYDRVGPSIRLEATPTDLHLHAMVAGQYRFLRRVEFSDHYTAEIPLRGEVSTGGQTVTARPTNVSIALRDGTIEVTGDIQF